MNDISAAPAPAVALRHRMQHPLTIKLMMLSGDDAGQRRRHDAVGSNRKRSTIVVVVVTQLERLLTSRPVLVVGVVLHVDAAQALRFVDERALLRLRQALPVGAESLRDL